MHDWIRDALSAHVNEMPQVRVLYNNCYGGFGFSKQFKAFLLEHNALSASQKQERVDTIQYISMFARQILDSIEHKGLREILYIYHYHGFQNIMSKVLKVIQLEKEKITVLLNLEIVKNYLLNPDSTYNENVKTELKNVKLPIWLLKLTLTDDKLKSYTKEDLEQLITDYDEGTFMKELDETLTSTIHQLTTQLGQDIYNEIDGFVELEIQKSSDECTNNWMNMDKDRYTPFVKLLEKNSYANDIVWKHQRFYESYAIKYLVMCYLADSDKMSVLSPDTVYDFVLNTQIPLKKDVMEVVDETFGLLCAGGSCSKLAIATVPAILEWGVGEYDGLESVSVI
jgi:hypothetical protein